MGGCPHITEGNLSGLTQWEIIHALLRETSLAWLYGRLSAHYWGKPLWPDSMGGCPRITQGNLSGLTLCEVVHAFSRHKMTRGLSCLWIPSLWLYNPLYIVFCWRWWSGALQFREGLACPSINGSRCALAFLSAAVIVTNRFSVWLIMWGRSISESPTTWLWPCGIYLFAVGEITKHIYSRAGELIRL